MPIEIRRFGVGHRRAEGPPGTTGIEAQTIHGDGSAVIAELAFGRQARITPHTNPNPTYFIVIEGGGWVGVGDERTRVTAGEAVVWPPDVLHAAWTDGSPMRAIVIELAQPRAAIEGPLEGRGRQLPASARPVSRGEGRLAPRPVSSSRPEGDPASEEGEPL